MGPHHSTARPLSRRRQNHFGLTCMSSVTPCSSPLRLPRGEVVYYPTGRPNIPSLVSQIAALALGYSVAVYPLQQPNLSRFPPGVWHWAVVLGEFILFIVPPSESAESSSDQSGYQSEDSPYYDSDKVNPEAPWAGYGYWHSSSVHRERHRWGRGCPTTAGNGVMVQLQDKT